MIIYFYLAKNKNKKREEKPGVPWVSKWNREQLVARNRAEIDGHMGIIKMAETKKLKEMKEKEKKEEKKKNKKTKPSSSSESDSSESDIDFSSKSESEEHSEEPRKKEPKRAAKKMESRKRKQILEDSSSKSKRESTDESEEFLPVKKQKSNKQIHTAAKKMPEVSLATVTDSLFQGQTEQSSVNKPSDFMFGREEESLSDPAQ
ncbi:hypothetical protein Ahy_A04g018889 isoform B [Arachis hypogaea]|uniref:Uncharacterized protein n=1 Tax=Arachis hypogaea TaxID=3818 RepID=A0A445DEV0_ARAHY|nr:hypothetical protein Ahy_A04g018889 isoform B [Arachis hypogaea]